MHPEPPDAELLALLNAARQGDPDALEGLLTELYPSVRMHAYRRVRDRRDAESLADDIAQETLLRVVQRIESCRAETPGALFGWALVITHRVFVDFLRNDGSHSGCVESTPDLEAVGAHAALKQWLSCSSTPESRGNRILSDLLSGVLRSLPDGMTTVLRLRVQTELTWPEIAGQVRTTAAGAKRRFQRAQRRVRKQLLAEILRLPSPEQQTVSVHLRRMGVSIPLASPADDGQ